MVPAAVSGLLVMIGATPVAATVMVSVALPVPMAFVAPSSTTVVPAAVGEPEAVIAKLNAVPTVPPAVSGLLVMIGATPVAATVIVSVAVPMPVLFVAPSS